MQVSEPRSGLSTRLAGLPGENHAAGASMLHGHAPVHRELSVAQPGPSNPMYQPTTPSNCPSWPRCRRTAPSDALGRADVRRLADIVGQGHPGEPDLDTHPLTVDVHRLATGTLDVGRLGDSRSPSTARGGAGEDGSPNTNVTRSPPLPESIRTSVIRSEGSRPGLGLDRTRLRVVGTGDGPATRLAARRCGRDRGARRTPSAGGSRRIELGPPERTGLLGRTRGHDGRARR